MCQPVVRSVVQVSLLSVVVALAVGCGPSVDGGRDAGSSDANTVDAWVTDARSDGASDPDAVATDASVFDAGPDGALGPDAMVSDGGVLPVFLQRNGANLVLGGQPFQAIAMNKFDLFYQFLGVASNSPATVTRPQAITAMNDAVAAGVCCFRVAAMPYWPVDTDTYVNQPADFWAAFDDMMAELRARGLKIVPVVWWNAWLFPDLAGEPMHDIFSASSVSNDLLLTFAGELATRYGADDTVLFWDLTNEINLNAELDFGVRTTSGISVPHGSPAARSAADNYTSDEMATLLADLTAHMKSFDPNHLVSSGYSVPRSYAWHLRADPEWAGDDKTPDSISQMEQYLALTHPDPIDIVSIHLYPDADRLGFDGRDPGVLGRYQDAADALAKPLFVGEFGDTNPTVSELRSANFTRRCMLEMLQRRVPLSLIWVWEFYQFNPSVPSTHSIEPGVDDALIAAYSEIDSWLGAASNQRGSALTVPNGSFEADTNGNDLADGWETTWRNGSSTGWLAQRQVSASDAFDGDAWLRLDNGTGDPASFAYALCDPMAVNGGEDLIVSAAIRRHLTGAQRLRFTLIEYDQNGTEIRVNTHELDDAIGWVFRVEYQRVVLLPSTRSVRIRLGAGGEETTIVDIDDVRLMQVAP
jgi:Cellulase (glycosyl hydrolase family 5)